MAVTRSWPMEVNRGSGPASVQQGRRHRGMTDAQTDRFVPLYDDDYYYYVDASTNHD